jgi:hypothetical protein
VVKNRHHAAEAALQGRFLDLMTRLASQRDSARASPAE